VELETNDPRRVGAGGIKQENIILYAPGRLTKKRRRKIAGRAPYVVKGNGKIVHPKMRAKERKGLSQSKVHRPKMNCSDRLLMSAINAKGKQTIFKERMERSQPKRERKKNGCGRGRGNGGKAKTQNLHFNYSHEDGNKGKKGEQKST